MPYDYKEHKDGKPLTPEQQRTLDEYQQKYPNKSMDEIFMLMASDVAALRGHAVDQTNEADATAKEREQRKQDRDSLKEFHDRIENNVKNSTENVRRMPTSRE